MPKYKNISDQVQVIVEVGEFKPGEEFETEKEINNPNFELIGQAKRFTGVDPVTETPKRGNK